MRSLLGGVVGALMTLVAVLAAQSQTFTTAPPTPEPPPSTAFRPLCVMPTRGDFTVYVSEAHDGDTFTACLMVPVKVRLFGVNCPELPTAEGKLARDYVNNLIVGKQFSARLFGVEKYGRTLGDLCIDGKWLSEIVISSGHAKPYSGHGPRP